MRFVLTLVIGALLVAADLAPSLHRNDVVAAAPLSLSPSSGVPGIRANASGNVGTGYQNDIGTLWWDGKTELASFKVSLTGTYSAPFTVPSGTPGQHTVSSLIMGMNQGQSSFNLLPPGPTATPTLAPTKTPTPAATGTPTATASPTPTGSPPPNGPPGTWNMVFDDEFSGTSLDTTKWITCYPWDNNGCTNSNDGSLNWYAPGQVSVSGGYLHLTALHQTVVGSDGKTYNYVSGMVTTAQHDNPPQTPAKFAFTYGYMEMRAEMPNESGQPGLWPAFWLLPTSEAWPPEIDAFEGASNYPSQASMTYHWSCPPNYCSDQTNYIAGSDLSAGYHTYGVDWEPNSITWYVDGQVEKTYTNTSTISNVPMYVLVDLAVDGNSGYAVTPNTPFPATMNVDYVRVWQHP